MLSKIVLWGMAVAYIILGGVWFWLLIARPMSPVPATESALATGAVISVHETHVISSVQRQLTFPFLLVLHDDDNKVTCWALVPVTGVGGLDCMPDAEFAPKDTQ